MSKDICNVFVRMGGGLGNQLFQLGAGLYAAHQYPHAKVWLDTRFLGKYATPRNLEVDFVVKHLPSVGIAASVGGGAGLASRLRLGRLLDAAWGGHACIGSIEGLKRLKGAHCSWVVLDGYFQHPDLVLPTLERLNLFAKLSGEFGYLLDRMPSSQGVPRVGIHIRRGDYVSSKAASSVFKTISLDYYRTAVKSFPANAQFLVFGDDPGLVSSFAKEIGGIDIPLLGMSSAEDFMLLALCDHYIIANSTFSWWASYLGWKEGKRVISPKDWYLDQGRNQGNPLLLPYFELA